MSSLSSVTKKSRVSSAALISNSLSTGRSMGGDSQNGATNRIADRCPIVSLQYKRRQKTSSPWTSFTPYTEKHSMSPTISDTVVDSDVDLSLPEYIFTPYNPFPLPESPNENKITHPDGDTNDEHYNENKDKNDTDTKKSFYSKILHAFPKKRRSKSVSKHSSMIRSLTTQPTKSDKLATVTNSLSQPTLISYQRKENTTEDAALSAINSQTPSAKTVLPTVLPQSDYSLTRKTNSKSAESNSEMEKSPLVMSSDSKYTSGSADMFSQSNKTSPEMGLFLDNNSIPFHFPMKNSAKVVSVVQQRLSEDYQTLQEENQRLTANYKAVRATNILYKKTLKQLEESTELLQKENTTYLHTNIKYQFLKLETSDLSKKADLVKTRLVNKERVVNNFKRQFDELKLTKDTLSKEKEVALIEVQHNKNKLSELSEIAKELEVIRKEDVERRIYFNRLQQSQGDLRVILCVKPTNTESCISFLTPNKVSLVKEHRKGIFTSNSVAKQPKNFEFSRVFQSATNEVEVQDEVLSIADGAIGGFNASVISYGQTGSGKTSLMFGSQSSNAGLAHRLIWRILDCCNEGSHNKYSVIMTVIELYRKRVYDLIRDKEVKLEDDGNRVILRDTEEVLLDSKEEVSVLLEQVRTRRHTATTRLNVNSSRGHVVVILRVYGFSRLDKTEESHGALMICDTAGFDSFLSRKHIKLERSIHSSLQTLGTVLKSKRSLKAQANCSSSTLTQILRPCISNDAKCCLLITCHSDSDQYPCILQSLQFGKNALASNTLKTNNGPSWDFGKSVVHAEVDK